MSEAENAALREAGDGLAEAARHARRVLDDDLDDDVFTGPFLMGLLTGARSRWEELTSDV